MLRKALPTTEAGQIEKLLMSTFRRRLIQEKPQLLPVRNDVDFSVAPLKCSGLFPVLAHNQFLPQIILNPLIFLSCL